MKAFIVVALLALVATAAFAAPHHEAGHTTEDHSAHGDHSAHADHEHVDATKEEPTAPVADKAKDETLTGSAATYFASPFAYSAYPAFRAYPYAAYGAYPYGYHGYGAYPLYYR